MKLKLLIVITILVVIGVAIIAVVKRSNSVQEKPEITEVTTDVQVERELEVDYEKTPEGNLRWIGNPEKGEKLLQKDIQRGDAYSMQPEIDSVIQLLNTCRIIKLCSECMDSVKTTTKDRVKRGMGYNDCFKML